MELSTTREATSCVATQEFPSIFWNTNVHYHIHKSRLLVPVLSQTNPVHVTPSSLSKIQLNVIHLPTALSSWWSFSFWLSHEVT
jgi:hypothetical protein